MKKHIKRIRKRKVNMEIVIEINLRNYLRSKLPLSFMTNKPQTVINILSFNSMEM